MRKIIALALLLALTHVAIAATIVRRTVTMQTAGVLKDSLNTTEQETVTHLTLSGPIDTRDIAFVRDHMDVVRLLDLRGASIVGYSGSDGTRPVPAGDLLEYPDDELPQYSFYNLVTDTSKQGLDTVYLPTTLTAVGYRAFDGCIGLSHIGLPDGLRIIRGSAFYRCVKLSTLNLPSQIDYIDRLAFSQCRGLTGVLTLPPLLPFVAEGAFANCSNITRVDFPEGMKDIGRFAFQGCTGLTSLTLPKYIATIDEYAFERCTSIPSVVLPERLISVNRSSFAGCASMSKVVFPEGLVKIGFEAFAHCTQLKTARFPSTLYLIDSFAFYKCPALDTLVLPASLDSIGRFVFNECTGLRSVLNLRKEPLRIDNTVFYGVDMHNCELRVHTQSINKYIIAPGWKNFLYIKRYAVIGTWNYDVTQGKGTATGMGVYNVGDTAVLQATAAENFVFKGWFTRYNTEGLANPLRIKVSQDSILTPLFLSTDASLQSLTVTTGVLVPAFHPDTFSYTVTLDSAIGNFTLMAYPNYPRALVTGTGQKIFNEQINAFTIHVTAEDKNTTREYRVVVAHDDDIVPPLPSPEDQDTPQPSAQTSSMVLSAYPNPITNNSLTLDPATGDNIGTPVEIYNMGGTLIYQTMDNTIDFAPYSRGIYLIRRGNQQTRVMKP